MRTAAPGDYDLILMDLQMPVMNGWETAVAIRALPDAVGQEGLLIPERPALGGEDFSFYCEKVPSAFFWLGCHDPAKPPIPIHHGAFAPAEESLPIGMGPTPPWPGRPSSPCRPTCWRATGAGRRGAA